jgi:hypothetical protein
VLASTVVVPMRDNEIGVLVDYGAETFGARRRTIYVFFDKCAAARAPVTPKCVERIALGRTSQAGPRRVVPRNRHAAVGGRQAELWGDEQWMALKQVVEERKPKVIGIDRSTTFAFSDGLSSGELQGMSEALGSQWTSRFRDAEGLPLDLIASRLPEEEAFFAKMTALVWQMSSRCSRRVIVPGRLARATSCVGRQQRTIRDWAPGSSPVSVQRKGVKSEQLGGIRHSAWRRCTGVGNRRPPQHRHATQRLRPAPGETGARRPSQKALANELMQDIAMEETQPGTGNEVLASVRNG